MADIETVMENLDIKEIEVDGQKLYLFGKCAFPEKETIEILAKINEEKEKSIISSTLMKKVLEKKANKLVEDAKKELKNLFEKHMGEIYGCMNDVFKRIDDEFKSK